MGGHASDRRAPGGLELVRAFVNTRDIDEGTDLLAETSGARRCLADIGLPVQGELGAAAHGRLLGLREDLRRLLVANATGDADEEAAAAVNGAIARLALRPVVDGQPTRLGFDAPPAARSDPVGALLVHVLAAVGEGTWARLKACPDPTCHWAYYDTSKNRSARWCDMRDCGARAKRAAFRARHRRESVLPPSTP